MTQPILLTGHVYAVEVPEGATEIEALPDECDDTAIAYKGTKPKPENVVEILCVLPGLGWQLIGTTQEITEDIAKGIVGSSEWYFPTRHTRYIDYAHPFDAANKQEWSVGFGKPLESFRSLLTSKGLDENKNYVLLKKQ